MEIFNNENYKHISSLVEKKIAILKEKEDINKKNTRERDAMEE